MARYRAVLDANVLVSARISPKGIPARLLEAAEAGRFELVISEHLLEEVRDVLSRSRMRRYLPEDEVSTYIERVGALARSEADPDDEAFAGHTPDPKDDYLLALAAACATEVMVSGDPHLLNLEDPPASLRVLTPRAFLEELEGTVS